MRCKISVVLFLVGLSLNAQENFTYGFHGGTSFSLLRSSGLSFQDLFSTKTGLLIGVYGNYNFSKRSTIVVNIAFEQKGATSKFGEIIDPSTGMPFGYNEEVVLNYLVLLLSYKYKIGDGKVKFFLNAGPFVGFLLSSNTETNLIAEFDTIDFGFSGGSGLDYSINQKNTIFFEFRTNIGSQSIPKLMISDGINLKTTSSNVVLGFTLE
jgi:hypothetical protein